MNKKKKNKKGSCIICILYMPIYVYIFVYKKNHASDGSQIIHSFFFWSNSTFCQIQIPSNYLIWSVPSLCYRCASLLYRLLCSWLTQAMATNRPSQTIHTDEKRFMSTKQMRNTIKNAFFFVVHLAGELKRRPMAAKLSGWIRQSAEMNLLAIAAGADEDC